jgi:hypothetical protein
MEKFDCLRLGEVNAATTKVEYCRRSISGRVFEMDAWKECDANNRISFYNLFEQGVTSLDLLKVFAPIDIVDRYQLFVEKKNNNFVIDNDMTDYYCNCSSIIGRTQTFGFNCEYSFDYKLTKSDLQEHEKPNLLIFIIKDLHQLMQQTRELRFTVTNGSCYMGLSQCKNKSTRPGECLHWSEICNGKG